MICRLGNDAPASRPGESLGARYRSQTFVRPFTSVIAHRENDVSANCKLANRDSMLFLLYKTLKICQIFGKLSSEFEMVQHFFWHKRFRQTARIPLLILILINFVLKEIFPFY